MKINQKVFRSIQTEPFLVQNVAGKELQFHYLNDTNYLAENVSKGRFYLWASDGVNYKLIVEKGFYEKVKYFFAEDINEIWLNFLQEAGAVRKKTAGVTMLVSLIPIILVVLGFVLFEEQGTYILIGGLAVSLIANMMYTSKLNKKIRELNQQAHLDIQDTLTKEVFTQFFVDQKEYSDLYYKENFGSDEDYEELEAEEVLEETLLVETEAAMIEDEIIDEIIEESLEETIEEEIIVDEIEEVVEEVKPKAAKRVDYSAMTVAELKALAKDMELTGYSALRKAELIKLIKKNK